MPGTRVAAQARLFAGACIRLVVCLFGLDQNLVHPFTQADPCPLCPSKEILVVVPMPQCGLEMLPETPRQPFPDGCPICTQTGIDT